MASSDFSGKAAPLQMLKGVPHFGILVFTFLCSSPMEVMLCVVALPLFSQHGAFRGWRPRRWPMSKGLPCLGKAALLPSPLGTETTLP